MKLNNLFEDMKFGDIQRRHASSPVEKGGFTNGKEFTGNNTSIQISYKPGEDKINGFQWHTHPVKGAPTPLGALPSAEDLESAIKFSMRSGHDKFSPRTKTFINDPSDVEGFAIIHGPYVFKFYPQQEVNLSMVSQYLTAIKSGDYNTAVNLLDKMGFKTELDYNEGLAGRWKQGLAA